MQARSKTKTKKAKTKARVKTLSKGKARTNAAPAKPAGKVEEIWRLKIRLVRGIGARGPWEATVDMRPSTNLLAVHRIIQNLVEFSDDHLFTFFIAASDTTRDRVTLEDEWQNARLDLLLEKIFPLAKGKKLFYWFDFGDDWHFSITCAANPKVAEKGLRYPQVIATQGETPKQYPGMDDDLE